MQFLKSDDGIALAYEDTEAETLDGKQSDSFPLLLVHGCGFDHNSLASQRIFFRTSRRVVSVDLRGHGQSDAPKQDYTMAGFADDLAWLCTQLGLIKPIVVGHSMGGIVALELAARHPEIPSSLVMIDSTVFPPQAVLDTVPSQFFEALAGPSYFDAYLQLLSTICLPTDHMSLEMMAEASPIPQHVLAPSLLNHTINYDASKAASACHVPTAYILSITPFLDLPRLQSLIPQLLSARTLGAGHFSPIEIPDQINAMIAQFIKVL